MLHEQSDKDKKQFRSFVLYLKKLHPSWNPKIYRPTQRQMLCDSKKEWKKINVSLCQRMIDKIPARLKLVIDQGSNQIQEH